MKVARTVLNGESGSNAADLHNTLINYEKELVLFISVDGNRRDAFDFV